MEGFRVLLVDDDALTLEVFDFTLTEAGANVNCCASAKEALDKIQSWRPDVIVTDIGLPDADGYMLIRELQHRSETQNVPVIAVTGYSSREDQKKLTLAGFQRILGKPVDPFHLVRTIQDLLTRTN